MPRVVMVAKSTYVWLDQLSREHGRAIERLDQVPDAELDRLARRGFNALWLIGVWQRSEASRRIKQLRGQPDALASAYALYDYAIADDLGGEAGFADLKARAAARGIRMATDMVPNHVGIDGRWVVEHPERFVQLDHPPFPGYRFGGPDLAATRGWRSASRTTTTTGPTPRWCSSARPRDR
jgi:glycosidase